MGKETPSQNRRKRNTESKYDADNSIISSVYKEYAELRRELSDSKAKISERAELIRAFSQCSDPQKACLLLDDYFEKLSLTKKDFCDSDWWLRLMSCSGERRLEELAFLFMRSGRSLPPELSPYGDVRKFAEVEKAEREKKIVSELEKWLIPEQSTHCGLPRHNLRILCDVVSSESNPLLHYLNVEFCVFKSNGTREIKKPAELIEVVRKDNYELGKFTAEDIEFLRWFSSISEGNVQADADRIRLEGNHLFLWLSRWGAEGRLEMKSAPETLSFHGDFARIVPEIRSVNNDSFLWFRIENSRGDSFQIEAAKFFGGKPALCLIGNCFYVLDSPPPQAFFDYICSNEKLPVKKLTARIKAFLRRTLPTASVNWDEICIVHRAKPRFIFELNFDTINVRLEAVSENDGSLWQWNGHEWELKQGVTAEKPHFPDDERLDRAVAWLMGLDLFMPEKGVWVGDATEDFLAILATAWQSRPKDAEYLGNPAFQRIFLNPRRLKPKIIVRGSGIDWLSVSADWEIEGLKLTQADLERLAKSTQKYVKLPDAGWVELDIESVINAHEFAAELGLDGLSPIPEKIPVEQALKINDEAPVLFSDSKEAEEIKRRLKEFKGIEETPIPDSVKATLRPYQKDGFNFLCHLTKIGMGGILADDMGLGKTLQTLAWLAYLKELKGKNFKPALVICPASVLYNWKREIEKFTPNFKVLLLESGAQRHSLRKKIPQYDICITNYALLRRDCNELTKFHFSVVVLDEAQFIKNPAAQITLAVKQLKADQRIALTGTPLENHLLDLWSIVDFVQPGYLGDQSHFLQTYDPPSSGDPDSDAINRRIARKRLSAKLRPIMIRRLKQQVATDLPDRIEERRDCELTDLQKKLYLAELKRSREQITQIMLEKGIKRSKIHVLAALTRLRQICCHPALVGNDASSGKTDTLFELLEPLIEEGHKVLLFSQFVQMLKILEGECAKRQIKTYILTGETKERMSVVNAFQSEPEPCVFLLSLRAAGTGLNLTNASYVILYDPWWNPAVEAQAIDRSHRIGQTRNVNAYRLITLGTVEEKIWELQQQKSKMIADVLGEEGFARSLTQEDIEFLFS